MMIATAATACVCGDLGEWSSLVLASPTEVRRCDEHHRYWRGSKELLSVSHVIKSVWPFKPNFTKADPAVLENANHRGIEVDWLWSRYLAGELKVVPAGTRQDALRLFLRLKRWWSEHAHGDVRTQVILADDQVAGTADILDVDQNVVFDLKTTYAMEAFYACQVGAYGALHYATFGKPVKKLGIIHLTKRYPVPQLIQLDPAEVIQDWLLVRDTYFMARRRTGKL
jgi:hypothetical protein